LLRREESRCNEGGPEHLGVLDLAGEGKGTVHGDRRVLEQPAPGEDENLVRLRHPARLGGAVLFFEPQHFVDHP
jgi:hypothetical protein